MIQTKAVETRKGRKEEKFEDREKWTGTRILAVLPVDHTPASSTIGSTCSTHTEIKVKIITFFKKKERKVYKVIYRFSSVASILFCYTCIPSLDKHLQQRFSTMSDE